MLKRRWDKFMCPNGIERTFNPKKWEHGTSFLVFGEVLALGAAIAAIPGWTHGKWFLYAAPIIAAGALAWYALDKSTLGEMPLTGVSANRIANVARMVNMEQRLGPVIRWGAISADGTRAEMALSKMNPEAKNLIARHLAAKVATEQGVSLDINKLRLPEADADAILDALAPGWVPLNLADRPAEQDPDSP